MDFNLFQNLYQGSQAIGGMANRISKARTGQSISEGPTATEFKRRYVAPVQEEMQKSIVPKIKARSEIIKTEAKKIGTDFLDTHKERVKRTEELKDYITPNRTIDDLSKPLNSMYADEVSAVERMREDGWSDNEINIGLRTRRLDLMGGRDAITEKEKVGLKKMQEEGLSSEEAIRLLDENRAMEQEARQKAYDELPTWKKVGQGTISASLGTVSTIGSSAENLLGWGAKKLGAEQFGNELQKNAQEWKTEQDKFASQNEATQIGGLVGNVVGGTGMMAAVPGSSGVLGAGAGLGARVAEGVAIGGIMGAGTDIATGGEVTASGTLGGAVLGGALPLAGAGIVKGIQKLSPVIKRGMSAAVPLVRKGASQGKEGVATIGKSAIAGQSGLNVPSIESIIKNPGLQKKIRSGELSSEKVLNEARGSIEKIHSDLSETGKMYNKIRDYDMAIPKSEVKGTVMQHLKDEGIDGVTSKELIDMPLNDRKAIQQAVSYVDEYGDNMSPKNLLSLRQKLDDLVGWKSEVGTNGERIVKGIRAKVDKYAGEKLPGLKEIDAQFAPERQFWGQIRKDLYNKDGSLKDRALSTIMNITNKGNEARLGRMEQVMPGITEKIGALKAFDDIQSASGIKVGTYTRNAVTGGVAIANPVAGIALWVATHPVVVGRVLESFGYAKQSIIKMIAKGKNISTADAVAIKKAVDATKKADIEKIILNTKNGTKNNPTSRVPENTGVANQPITDPARILPGPSGKVTGAKNFRVNQPVDKSVKFTERVSPTIRRPGTTAKETKNTVVQIGKETIRKGQLYNVEKELNTALLSKYSPNKPETAKKFIESQISQGKITEKEGLAMVEKLKSEAGGFDKPHYEKIIKNGFSVESFDDMIGQGSQKLTQSGPKIIRDIDNMTPQSLWTRLDKMANDGRTGGESWQKIVDAFKKKTGKDPMKMSGYPDFNPDGTMKSLLTKDQIQAKVGKAKMIIRPKK